jgi:hypothetical protein
VVGLSSGQPIADATVSTFAPGFPDGRLSVMTDNLGRFTLAGLPPGRYTIGATKPGFLNVIHVVGLRRGSYRLATLLDVEFGAWFDPVFVRQLESVSMPLTIADRDRKVLNLRVPK